MFEVNVDSVITADSQDIKALIENAYKTAIAQDINTDVSTPEGQLILNDENLLEEVQTQVVKAVNIYNIFTAFGAGLDSIGASYGYYRKKGASTVVQLTFNGLENTQIPALTICSNGTYEFATLESGTIDETGFVSIQAQCTTQGEIIVLADSITEIVTQIENVDSVTNPLNGLTGFDEETDNEFRQRILTNFMSIRAKTTFGAIEDNIKSLTNVLDCYMQENPTQNTVIVNDLEMPKNSIYVCVAGGTDEEIAEVLAVQKTAGAEMIGDITLLYEDLRNQQFFKIQRATPLEIKAKITYKPTNYTPSNIQERAKEYLESYLNTNRLKIFEVVTSGYIFKGFEGFNFSELLEVEISVDGVNYSNFINTTVSQYGIINDISFVEV